MLRSLGLCHGELVGIDPADVDLEAGRLAILGEAVGGQHAVGPEVRAAPEVQVTERYVDHWEDFPGQMAALIEWGRSESG